MNGANGHGNIPANGHAAPNGSSGTMTEATNSWAPTPAQAAFDKPTFSPAQQAEYPPSRVYVPPSGVPQV